MSNPKFLILSGDGINCERETSFAFTQAGATAEIIHVNHLLENKHILNSFQGMALPGGFSFGDELGSGQVLATKLKHGLLEEIFRFVEDGKPVIGICNGFQVLTKLGLLPDHKKEREMALAPNVQGEFIDRWIGLKIVSKTCIWTKGLENLEMPVRHGEGRIVFTSGSETQIYDELMKNDQIAFEYSEDINGSYNKMAGVSNKLGTVLGMMPHPEAAVYGVTQKIKTGSPWEEAEAFGMFKNAVNYLK